MAENSENVSPPTPVPIAFLLCERVIIEEGTRKKTIIGVWNNINAPTLPFTQRPVCLYARLIDGEGRYALKMVLIQVETQEKMLTIEGEITAESRHNPIDFASPIFGLTIPAAGEYEFSLWMNDRYIHRVRFYVKDASQGATPA